MNIHYLHALFLSIGLNYSLIAMESAESPDPNPIASQEERSWIGIDPMTAPSSWHGYKANFCIRKRDLCNKPGAKDLMVVFIVHGTTLDVLGTQEAGPHNPDFFDDKTLNYKGFKKFILWYANEHNKNVEVLSFRWSGLNLHLSRRRAAKFLNDYIGKNYPTEDLGFIAHSHGCNVVNILTKMIQRPIEVLIYFACPVREIDPREKDETKDIEIFKKACEKAEELLVDDYSPINFEFLLFFFSTSDPVAQWGANHKWSLVTAVLVPAATYGAKKGFEHLGGKYIKPLKWFAERPMVTKYASAAASVVMNSIVAKAAQEGFEHVSDKQKNANVFKDKPGNHMVGFRVQFNGVDASHSDTPSVAALLIHILYYLSENYPHHGYLNSLFDVNIDAKRNKSEQIISLDEDSLALRIRERGNIDKMVDAPFEISNRSLKEEEEISHEQEKAFRARHPQATNPKEHHTQSSCNVM